MREFIFTISLCEDGVTISCDEYVKLSSCKETRASIASAIVGVFTILDTSTFEALRKFSNS